jgi:hypothetical protein
MSNLLSVRVARLEASIPEGIAVRWQGRELPSGPLKATLADDAAANGPASSGVLDYNRRRARLEFHVKLEFPEFAETLAGLGVDPAYTAPVRAIIRSEGDILEDHGFGLSGACDVLPHGLFADPEQPERERASAQMLPGT